MKEFFQDGRSWALSAGLVMLSIMMLQLIFTKEK